MDVPRYNFTSASNKISIVNSELNIKKQTFEGLYLQFLSKYGKYGKYTHPFTPLPPKSFVL